MRRVSDVALGTEPEISKKRCANSRDVSGGFPGLISFSMRSVARPVNGLGLLGSGGVEQSAKIESAAHAVPPAGRHTVARYCRPAEALYSAIPGLQPGAQKTLYV